MLHRNPSCRPTANAVASHAVWWGSELRLRFLCELSDRVEHEDREQARGLPEWVHPDTAAPPVPALFCAFLGAVHAQDRTLLAALEDGAAEALGPGPWDQLVHGAILESSQVVPPDLSACLLGPNQSRLPADLLLGHGRGGTGATRPPHCGICCA